MGAAFLQTVANIFYASTQEQPFLLTWYIDDIFMIWPHNQDLDRFLHNLNDKK